MHLIRWNVCSYYSTCKDIVPTKLGKKVLQVKLKVKNEEDCRNRKARMMDKSWKVHFINFEGYP